MGRRPGPSVRTRVVEVTDDGRREREDRLATEEPLEIRVSWPGAPARRIWVTMRTPGHDFDLAAGFLSNEGVEDIRSVAYCTDAELTPEQEFNVVTVQLGSPAGLPSRSEGLSLSAGSAACGVCGTDSVDLALSVRRPRVSTPLDVDLVRTLPTTLRQRQKVFATTGGLHAAGLFTERGDELVVREDIGRHNAVDKVMGARVLAHEPPGAAYLCVSGRLGYELVQKAVASGVGTLVGVGAPSSLAVRLAREAGLGLVGFTDASRCVVYADPALS